MPRGTSLYDAANIERRLWTPQMLMTDGWYDASHYPSLIYDLNVTTWKDKKETGADLQQGTSGKQPDWLENSFNNKPSVSFDGVNDEIVLSAPITFTTSHTFIWVGTIVESPSASSAFFHGVGTQEGPNNFNSGLYWYTAASGDILQVPTFTTTNPTILSVNRNSTTWVVRSNGTNKTPVSTTINTGVFASFGRSYGDFSTMKIAEFWISPTSSESWNVTKGEGYAAHKWNMVSSLDSSHQYKNKPALRDAG